MSCISSKSRYARGLSGALLLVILGVRFGYTASGNFSPNIGIEDSDNAAACGGVNLGTTLNPNEATCATAQWFNIRATGTSRAAGAEWLVMGQYNGDFDRALPLTFGIANQEIMTLDYTGLHVNGTVAVTDSNNAVCGGVSLGTTLNPNDATCATAQWFNIRATGTSRAAGAKWLVIGQYNGDFDRALPLTFGIANQEIMTLDHTGLTVNRTVQASVVAITSDVRLKTNITPLTGVLEKLARLRGVSFAWNETYKAMGRGSDRPEIGVIAQDVEAVFPELVTTWGQDGYKAVDYGKLSAVLIVAVKELQADTEARLAAKDAHIAALEARLAGMDGRLVTLEGKVAAAGHPDEGRDAPVQWSAVGLFTGGPFVGGLLLAGLILGRHRGRRSQR